MKQYEYLLEKILDHQFEKNPFKFLYIEDFFSKAHFEMLTTASQINLKKFENTEELIKELDEQGYAPVSFPGCTTSVGKYLAWYNNPDKSKMYNNDLLEGFGMSMRMHTYKDKEIEGLINFLNSDRFMNTMMHKFEKKGNVSVETAIQKYLTGYEISPHPDIRKKCMTYMININTESANNDTGLHTHFMKFTKDKEYIVKYWNDNPSHDRCWVPWDWCTTEFKHTKNNSITMFAPENNTIHAIKLDYDHTKYQRTQIYGNLWYTKGRQQITKRPDWRDL